MNSGMATADRTAAECMPLFPGTKIEIIQPPASVYEDETALKYVCVLDLQVGSHKNNDSIALEAFVSNCPDVPRWEEVSGKPADDGEYVAVITVTLFDRTGCILMDWWGSQAEDVCKVLTRRSGTEGQS